MKKNKNYMTPREYKEVWLCSDNTWIASKHWLR